MPMSREGLAMENPCSHCEGTGRVMCPVCLGTGRQQDSSLPDQDCPKCGGKGEVACDECGGRGVSDFTELDNPPGRIAL